MARLLAPGLCLALLASSLTGGSVLAGAKPPGMVLYRYLDSRGVKVLDSQGVPPEYAGKGYEVLNQQGRVIQVVAPAPTAEELHLRQAAQAQADQDAQLLKKYPSQAEVERALERRLTELDSAASAARANLQALQVQQQYVQGQAAEQERAGRPVVQGLLDELAGLREQRAGLEANIARYAQARLQAQKDCAALKLRLAPLWAR